MSLHKSFTDACGNVFEAAHFRAVQINIGAADKTVNVVFYAYKDAEAFASGKQPLPGGLKSYSITGDEFLGLAAAAPVGTTLYDVIAHAAEDYAVNKFDTPTGENDADGKPILVSYFDGATRD